jgi:hypothetical protein
MGVIPTTIVSEIEFGEEHAPLWVTNKTALSLTTAQTDAVTAAVAAARKAYTDANAARLASKNATIALKNAMNTLHPLLATIVQDIRLTAESTDNPSLYTLGGIPAPAAPTPAPPPMQPVQLGAQIRPDGVLRITFKATDSGNGAVAYIVSRKLASQTSFSVIGTTGSSTSTSGAGLPRGFKFFDDVSLPSGANNMQYMIQGQRGLSYGTPSEVFTVTIGVGAGGGMVAELKMAA